MSPFLADRVGELKSWDDVKLLSVTVDRLRKWWRPGLLCIGDAAHAMSPIGGVGINMAVQDAVAAANRLAGAACARHRDRRGPSRDPGSAHVAGALHAVAAAHYSEAGHQPRARHGSQRRPKPPLFFKLFGVFPVLRRIPARLLGVGIRPEHVRTPEASPALILRRFSCAAAIPRRCGRGFRQGSLRPRRRLRAACRRVSRK